MSIWALLLHSRGKKHPQACLYTPPPHYHLLQAEHFLVLSGTGHWHLSKNRTIRLRAGDTISIPALAYHWFENAPDSDEPLEFGYWYTAEYTASEQRFFRNTIGYIADCKRAGLEVSVVQLCVFSLRNWIVIGVVNLGWAPNWVSLVVNTVLTVLVAGWGEFVLGYRASYEEYSREHEKMGRCQVGCLARQDRAWWQFRRQASAESNSFGRVRNMEKNS